jgi:hypothetical protein
MHEFIFRDLHSAESVFEERKGQLEILIHHTAKSHLLLSNVAVEKLDSESNQPSIYNNLTHHYLNIALLLLLLHIHSVQ